MWLEKYFHLISNMCHQRPKEPQMWQSKGVYYTTYVWRRYCVGRRQRQRRWWQEFAYSSENMWDGNKVNAYHTVA